MGKVRFRTEAKFQLFPGASIIAVVSACLASGCAVQTPHQRSEIAGELSGFTRASIAPEAMPASFEWAPGVSPADGLSPDEAVATALWNNAEFELRLAELGVARADLVTASQLPNPSLMINFPEGPQIFDALFALPIDWLARSSRIDRSSAELDRLLAGVHEAALLLARDTRVAHAELEQARLRLELMRQFAALMQDMADIAVAREEVGRTSVRIATQSQADAADAAAQAAQAEATLNLAANRLIQLLGFDGAADSLQLQVSSPPSQELPSAENLLAGAIALRPEIKAAEAAMLAAGAEAGFERARILELIARLTLIETENAGSAINPGLQIGLPVFNQNQGGRLRAQANIERAAAGYVAAQRLVRRQVNDALAAFAAANKSYLLWRDEVVPGRQREADLTQDAYELGQVSYFDWTLSQTNYVRAQMALADSAFALQRAFADIERGIARRIQNEEQ